MLALFVLTLSLAYFSLSCFVFLGGNTCVVNAKEVFIFSFLDNNKLYLCFVGQNRLFSFCMQAVCSCHGNEYVNYALQYILLNFVRKELSTSASKFSLIDYTFFVSFWVLLITNSWTVLHPFFRFTFSFLLLGFLIVKEEI